MSHQSHFLGSYNDQDHLWAANISKQYLLHYKPRKPTFLVELENGQYAVYPTIYYLLVVTERRIRTR
jgi:hypothetical protein